RPLPLNYPSINILHQKKPGGYTRPPTGNLCKSDVVALIILRDKTLKQIEQDYKEIIELQ
ncbi:argininosuccinate lyase, partial [Francisella tularensis subsp. holarctica]|nr:argininosuccinate lyase [Francisella tularensis subsp. holarctica]